MIDYPMHFDAAKAFDLKAVTPNGARNFTDRIRKFFNLPEFPEFIFGSSAKDYFSAADTQAQINRFDPVI